MGGVPLVSENNMFTFKVHTCVMKSDESKESAQYGLIYVFQHSGGRLSGSGSSV